MALAGAIGGLGATGGPPEAEPEPERLERDADAQPDGLLSALARLGGARAPSGPSPLRWQRPEGASLLVAPSPFAPPSAQPGELRAHAYQYVSRVFERPHGEATAIGFVRRGVVLPVLESVAGRGCKRGRWYRLRGRGFVCSRDGFAIGRKPIEPVARQRLPAVQRALPFEYAKARPGALRFHRIPTQAEEREIAQALSAEQRLPDVVEGKLDGVYLLGLDRIERDAGREMYRTVRGRYVRPEDVEPKPEPQMRGERLDGARGLPLAFVYGEEPAVLYRLEDGRMSEAGTADRHARFAVSAEPRWQGAPMAVRADGVGVERARVRIARARPRPEGVGPADKWIHVDLDEQTLVAYEGDVPVFATLVSSGKGPDFLTPAGLFRVREKHITTTMSGPDPDEGYYEVSEVPWTQYYHDSYALHGAYWHDDFGTTRSHGCTNIAPVDARWLFYWSDGALPAGWNAARKLTGSWVYMTRRS